MTDDLDRLLRDTLETEAQSYEPAGDGLTRIRTRVDARRARLRWLVPSIAIACTAAAVGGALAAPQLFPSHRSVAPPAAHGSPSPTPTSSAVEPTPSTSTGAPTALPNLPTVWPYQSRTEAAASEPDDVASSALPYLSDPKATAMHFVANYVGIKDRLQVLKTGPVEAGVGVTLGRANPNGRLFAVTTVYLVRVARGDNAPYVVVRADGPDLRITDVSAGPQKGAVTVTGRVNSIDESVVARLLAADGLQVAIGPPGAAGPVAPWHVTMLGFDTGPVPAGQFAVVASTQSAADGLISQLAVKPYTRR